ncbi:MAG TPA: LuxR C-terminal-related transcriptional regulator [Hydrogenophaga sp.]|uniref:helix-turn-helix transcriptional regulator n=1 Tax=Hydrogenophaga sp. TaxID=1904254 RepID=UPI002C6C53E1|nr:LuxR C-terminal-related transcriptional regulator [Hydrogenophaga sp.]HMN94247.1 LuxR C-terminal-related transcriptional regulator [Hydrogenophaga sp.]HMP11656.1 LuxR C-terminal-related transcriptional regulator [Hydrogenophaga sp.]
MWQVGETMWGNGGFGAGVEGAAAPVANAMLMRMLDEIDYGVLVIDERGRIQHTNHLARHELASARLVVSRGSALLGTSADHTTQIQQGLDLALRGQRKLVLLEDDEHELSLAFIPLSHPLETESPTVLVLLQRQNTSDNLAVRMFARSKGLSPSEESVMIGLCRGLGVPDIAREHGVAESTVRSQVKSLREKTGCCSIRKLMQRVNSLPPVVPALRIITPVAQNPVHVAHF